jgi:paraquat-inducible protein A
MRVSCGAGHDCSQPRIALLPYVRAPVPGRRALPPLRLATAYAQARQHQPRLGFLIASVVLYIPANILPVMETSSLFGAQRDTIMSGVVFLWKTGSWHLALIVFIASVLVPLLKILAIGLLLASVQQRSTWQPEQRVWLYRIVERIGRWSILDIYVVALLATLVQLRGFASIVAGPGAIAFGAVVVLTMLSALAFDPRLIWDPVSRRHA